MPFSIIRTDCYNPDFDKMIALLDDTLNRLNGVEVQEFFHHFNVIRDIDTVVLAYSGGSVVGCGCFKKYDDSLAEVKRMFVVPEMRGQGVAGAILNELETWAAELGYKGMVLETGDFLVEAQGLYKKHGFVVTENWGQYIGVENSVCMAKQF